MKTIRENFAKCFDGSITTNDWVGLPDNSSAKVIKGFISIVTDAEIGKDFRSAEKWAVVFWAKRDCSEIAMIIPGCRVACITTDRMRWKLFNHGQVAEILTE